MKKIIEISVFVILVLIGFLIWGSAQVNESKLKGEIDSLNVRISKRDIRIDSTHRVIFELEDSLDIAFIVIGDLKRDREKAEQVVKKWKQEYEKVSFTRFATDSIRESELSKLYPSISNN